MSRRTQIEKTIQNALNPLYVEVVDESHMHTTPAGSESHVKITVVSDSFENMRLVERHRIINDLLANEFAHGLHAAALHTLTSGEWLTKGGVAPTSPRCLGGSKAEVKKA